MNDQLVSAGVGDPAGGRRNPAQVVREVQREEEELGAQEHGAAWGLRGQEMWESCGEGQAECWAS